MAEERERSEWDRTSSLLANLGGALAGETFSPAEFNPYRRDDLPSVDATSPENLFR